MSSSDCNGNITIAVLKGGITDSQRLTCLLEASLLFFSSLPSSSTSKRTLLPNPFHFISILHWITCPFYRMVSICLVGNQVFLVLATEQPLCLCVSVCLCLSFGGGVGEGNCYAMCSVVNAVIMVTMFSRPQIRSHGLTQAIFCLHCSPNIKSEMAIHSSNHL